MTIHIQNIVKRYKKNRGIEDVSFTLHSGTIVALVGANGAGKSTLIKILTGQTAPTAGEIKWEQAQELRYMPDDLSFPDTLTAKEIMALLGNLKKVSTEEQQQALVAVGLAEASGLKVGQFSKGMRQRLNWAQSMLGTGTLHILDEPTNGLDPYWIATLKAYLLEEKKRQQTVLFSTHLLSLAQEIADAVVLLHEGKVLVTGAVDSLLKEHQCHDLEQLWLKLTNKGVQL